MQNIHHFVGYDALTAVVIKSTVVWHITPCTPLEVNRRFGGTYRFNLQGGISRARYQGASKRQAYSTLKMEVICCFEMSVDFRRNARRYILEDNILFISSLS
jgi:hypothetical protein